MGKRELLIAVGFLLVGVVVYQIAAPPPKDGERRFSITGIFSNIRREIGANAASATVTKTGTIALPATVTELRITTLRRVPVVITGEDRPDVGYEFEVRSTGPDEATARTYAERSELQKDDLGTALALITTFPAEATQTARLILKVPGRLVVRVEGSSVIEVSGVGGLGLHNTTGEATVTSIAGAVTGMHRTGELQVTGAESIDLTLTATRARFTNITRAITLGMRNGSATIAGSAGALRAELTSAEATIDDHAGEITVTGDAGTTRINRPRGKVSLDVRRMLVEVVLDRAVPLSVLTSDEPLRLTLDGRVGLTLDALATAPGEVKATELGPTPTASEAGHRLAGAVYGGGPKAVLRNTRASIVIGPRK